MGEERRGCPQPESTHGDELAALQLGHRHDHVREQQLQIGLRHVAVQAEGHVATVTMRLAPRLSVPVDEQHVPVRGRRKGRLLEQAHQAQVDRLEAAVRATRRVCEGRWLSGWRLGRRRWAQLAAELPEQHAALQEALDTTLDETSQRPAETVHEWADSRAPEPHRCRPESAELASDELLDLRAYKVAALLDDAYAAVVHGELASPARAHDGTAVRLLRRVRVEAALGR